ncbi:hypothetical protein THAOC_09276 [Thalassiosira oceanica]|uniref:Trichome birefringence-like C-terminal domain-containing protein n=1 Tax=Thalassiosira oceanica TaxID=159749 RepID=K0SVI8_THAOC|nr:hypothetical protein THAOC_09276 [Thalassiosira oceanica]|eukprot:EJK69465.1 hypothetical protein THAOC_09276 [Thalassiosira oceanica]
MMMDPPGITLPASKPTKALSFRTILAIVLLSLLGPTGYAALQLLVFKKSIAIQHHVNATRAPLPIHDGLPFRRAYLITVDSDSPRTIRSKEILESVGFDVKIEYAPRHSDKVVSNKMAHLQIYARIANATNEEEGGRGYSYIFEDDIVLTRDVDFDANQLESTVEANGSHVVYLGICCPRRKCSKFGQSPHERFCGNCAHAYGVSREGATMLIEQASSHRKERYIDVIMKSFCHEQGGFSVSHIELQSDQDAGHFGLFMQDRKTTFTQMKSLDERPSRLETPSGGVEHAVVNSSNTLPNWNGSSPPANAPQTVSMKPTPQISCNTNGTSCIDPVGIVGEWVHVGPNRTFAAPVCCDRDNWGKMKPEVCGTEHSSGNFFSGFSSFPQQMSGRGCKCELFTDVYEWRSPHLPQTFNPVDTCRLLGNRTALFVGDSTMSQAASTLMTSLLPGKCQTQVTFALSDTLVGRSFGAMNRGKAWKDWVNEILPDITVVAIGAHVKTDDASYLGVIDEVLSDMIGMQSMHPRLKFAWKTQQPGGCTNEILSPKDVNVAANTTEHIGMYNYDKFYHRDLLLLDRLNRAKIPYLDMRMLYSRSDAHVSSMRGSRIQGDCLHLCSPGPLDVIGRLFHQLLLTEEWPFQQPPCNRAQVRNGSWATSTLPRAPYIPMDPWQKTCATRDGLDYSAPWKSYRWAPDDVGCNFAEWDACTFCDVLAAGVDGIGGVVDERTTTEGEVSEDDGRLADDERPLLSGRSDVSAGTTLEDAASSEEEDVMTVSFVGDSTTFQHYSSLALLLGLSVTEGEQGQSRLGGTSVTKMACDERVRLSYLRDDTLDKLHMELETQQSDIVVFNTGVHYRKDQALMKSINMAISTLENWQGICRLKKGSRRRWCLPILRTTVPGHPHCSNYTVPFNDLPTMEHRVQNANYSAFGPNYFWWKMKGQNRLVEDAFSQRSSTLDYEVLDAYDVMMRRPDGHQGGHDCVHYCLPGPPDVLSRMLLHTLVRRGRVLGHSSPTFFVSEIDQKEKSQYFICNRSISLPTYHDAEPEPSYKNDTLLLGGDKFGRMGNLWRVLFHGLDLARDRNLSFAVIRTSPVGRQIMHDVQGLFPFLSKDQVETIFGFRFIDSGEDQTLYQYVSAEAAFSYGGNDAGDAKRKKMTRAQLDAIQSQRRRLFIEVFRLMALAMVSDDSKTARQLCKSIESTGMTSTDAYTVIHSRSFATEGRPQSFLDMVNKRIGVHESGLIDFPSDMIFKILQPLGLEKEKVFMISDGLNMSSAEQLSASPQFAQTFRVVSDGDQFSDLILAVMSDVFIGNPLSTFSTLIAQIRYALGLSRNFLHVRLAGNGTWETFCEDENCFYKLHSV